MQQVNYKKLYAIKKENEKRIKKICPEIDNQSGIYFYTREDEDGIKYSYCGLAEHLLDRQLSHLTGFQWIDISLKSHGLYDAEKNPYGWKLGFKHFPKSELEEKERYYITLYAKAGYQSRNKDTGGGSGKRQINQFKPTKGYRDGIEQGIKNCSKEMAHLFDLHLDVTTKKNPPTVNQQKALDKFNDFLNFYKGSDESE